MEERNVMLFTFCINYILVTCFSLASLKRTQQLECVLHHVASVRSILSVTMQSLKSTALTCYMLTAIKF